MKLLKKTTKKELSKKILLNFEFACFSIIIDHTLISDMGDFTVFCLKAISEGATVSDIASITLLDADLINSQLSFVKQRGYLTKNNELTDKGRHLISILEFKEKHSSSVDFCIDAYIDDVNLKVLFKPEQIKAFESNEGIFVKPQTKQTRITRIASEFAKERLFAYLKDYLPEYKEFVEKEKDNLILTVEYKCPYRIRFDFTPEDLSEVVSFTENKGISIGLPVLVFESFFSTATDDEDIKDLLYSWIQQDESFSKKLIFNLLDGSVLDSIVYTREKEADDTAYIDKMVRFTELMPLKEDVKIPGNLFLFLQIQRSLKEQYAVGAISDTQLSSIFQKKVLAKDVEN